MTGLAAEKQPIEPIEKPGSEDEPSLNEETPSGVVGAASRQPGEQPNEEPEEVEITIQGVEPEKKFDIEAKDTTPDWVNNLRQEYRNIVKFNNGLTKELEQANSRIKDLEGKLNQPKEEDLKALEKPTLEACEYDTELYDEKMDAWRENQAKIKAQQEKKQQAQQAETEAWNKKLSDYQNKKNALKVNNYQDAEERVKQKFSVTQQGIMIKAANDPAVVVYALGKNSKIADELAAIDDPIEFTAAVARFEGKLTLTAKTRQAPPPEQKVTKGVYVGQDTELARLEAEADRTGDRTAINAYKRQLRREGKSS